MTLIKTNWGDLEITNSAICQFISPDTVIDYGIDRVSYISSDEIDKALPSFIGMPVTKSEHIFTFEDEWSNDLVVGIVENAYFDNETKKYVCEVGLTEEGYKLLNQLKNVSVGYISKNVVKVDREINGGILINQEHFDLDFNHLLLTDTPRLLSSEVQYINNQFENSKNDKNNNVVSCKSNYFINNSLKKEDKIMAEKKLKNAEDVVEPTPSETPAEPVSEPSNPSVDLQPLLDVINKLVSQVADLTEKVSQLNQEKADLVEEATKKEEDTPSEDIKPTEDVAVEPIEEVATNSVSKPLTFLERQELNKKLK